MVMQFRADIKFFKTKWIENAPFFHFMLFLQSAFFCDVQIKKGKHLLRHIDIIHLWYVVSSVAQKLYNIESFKYIRQKICNALKICHSIKVSGISFFNILSDKKVLIV